jgi:transporter family protein
MQKPLASLPVFFALIAISVFFPEMLGNLHTTLACCSFDSSFTLYAIASGIALAMAWIYLYRTLHLATASYMTLMSMVTPIIVSVLAILFLGEKLILIQIIGAGMIVLSGVVIYLSDIAYT